MTRLRRMGAAAGVAAVVVVLAGCGSGGGGDDGQGGGSSASASASASAMSVDEALDAYRQVTAPGCTDADSCQQFMTAKLAAADDLEAALRAENAARYAEPIADLERADRLADHYGRDNLAGRGNMTAVSVPIQDAIRWVSTNR